MKRIGLIGGVGPQATAYIYQKLLEDAQISFDAANNNDYPDILIHSVPVPDFISSKEHMDEAKRMLIGSAQSLEKAGCEALCIGSNTVHILLDDLRQSVSVPFISMVELVARRCKELDYGKVSLLGTPILLASGIYDAALNSEGIDLVKPNAKQMEVCDAVIRGVIAGNREVPMRHEYTDVLSSMFEQGADAIILGCTELPLVMDYEVLGRRVLSSDVILAHGMAEFCYSN